MTGENKGLARQQDHGRITDEGLAIMRSEIGVKQRLRGWNTTVTPDTIRHFAMGIGDDNPLWWDEAYAKASPHGGLIAPPGYLYSHSNGIRLAKDDGRESCERYLPGVMALWAGERWIWHRPVRPGETIVADTALFDVKVKGEGSFAGRSVLHTDRIELFTDAGEVVAEIFHTMKRFERTEAQSRASYMDRPLAQYTAADRERFAAHYAQEAALRRGNVPRYIEDVAVGDQVGPMLKGPLTLNALIGFMMGWGSGLNVTDRMFAALLEREPHILLVNPESGAADNYESPHWDTALARMNGLPAGYDFGGQRFCWFAHLLSDWAGDHGFLADLDFRLLRMNYINDVTWLIGTVTEVDLAAATAKIAIEATNQLDETTATGTGIVRLPRRLG